MRIALFVRSGLICLILIAATGPATSASAQSSRPGLGSMPYADTLGTGVTFRTWAPNATSVGVKGQFSGWATLPMTREGSTAYWSRDVAGASVGQEYKYVINGNLDRRDPRGRRVTNSAGNSIIYNPNAFDWGGVNAINPWLNDLVIYEMHVGSFNAEDWLPSSFDEAIEKLDHIEALGVTAVQVMPISEYAGDRSWGYNPADIYAVESSLGGPDAFKRFVKACHQRGIAVLVDVVHNHYGPSDLSMWQFDGWSQNGKGGIYFYNDVQKASTMWGDTRPDFGRPEVRSFINDHIQMLMEECRVDGLRWDSVFSILYYNGGSSFLPESEAMLRDINWMVVTGYPGRIRIAEDHGFDFNMNFQSQWDVGFHDHIKWQVTQSSDASRNMDWLADKISQGASHARVIFSESHDSVGDLNNKYRLPKEIDFNNPTSIWARKRQLLAASIVLTSPGIPMLFQGQEMHDDWTFSNNTALRWSLTNTWKGIVSAYSDMVSCRRNRLGGTQGLKGTGVNVHHKDNNGKVIGYVRWDAGGQVDDVVVVANFSVTKFTNTNYLIEFPSAGTWYTWFNSDATNYGNDFGGVVQTSVSASGSPPKAAVNMGSYSTIIFSKTPPPQPGILTVTPEEPTGCNPITLQYNTSGGPLAGATQVVANLGVNGWQFVTDIAFTNTGSGLWETTYAVPFDTEVVDLAFNNGAVSNAVWDNNLGKDWHIPIANCADLPALVTVNPAVPQGCIPVTIAYQERSGDLMNTTNVTLYAGRNGWQNVGEHTMTEGPNGTWTYVLNIPSDTWQLDYVFHNSGAGTNRIWDSNGGQDWHTYVSLCVDQLSPYITITNPASDISVSNEVTSWTLRGETGPGIVGSISWSNLASGAGGTIPVATNWSVASIPLLEGFNLLRVSATNGNDNPNAASRDSATNALYTTGNTWVNGQNGGSGWGGGWQLAGGAEAGHFLAQSTLDTNLAIGTHAWGLWAYGGGLSDAVRPLAGKLNPGDVVRLKFENNWIDVGAAVGVGFQNRFGQNLVEFLFFGGGSNYIVNDAVLTRDTGLPWTDQGVDLEFELLTPTTYRLVAGTNVITGDVALTSEALITRLRLFNFKAGGGPNFNLYVTGLSIDGDPLESSTFTDDITITRQFGPMSDQDGDGFLNWEEEFAGTDPEDAGSHLPDIEAVEGRSVMQIDIPTTVPARWYDIFMRTNLMSGTWTRQGVPAEGSGGSLQLTFTNETGEAFYRTGVFTP